MHGDDYHKIHFFERCNLCNLNDDSYKCYIDINVINEIKTLINKEDKEVIEVTSVNTTTTTKINEETTELNNKDYTELIEWIFLITSLGIIMLVVYYYTQ